MIEEINNALESLKARGYVRGFEVEAVSASLLGNEYSVRLTRTGIPNDRVQEGVDELTHRVPDFRSLQVLERTRSFWRLSLVVDAPIAEASNASKPVTDDELGRIYERLLRCEPGPMTHRLVPVGQAWEQRRWKEVLVSAVGRLCHVGTCLMRSNTHVLLLGHAAHVDIAEDALALLMERLLAAYKVDAARTRKSIDGMAWKRNYLVRAAQDVFGRVEEILERSALEADAEAISDYAAKRWGAKRLEAVKNKPVEELI